MNYSKSHHVFYSGLHSPELRWHLDSSFTTSGKQLSVLFTSVGEFWIRYLDFCCSATGLDAILCHGVVHCRCVVTVQASGAVYNPLRMDWKPAPFCLLRTRLKELRLEVEGQVCFSREYLIPPLLSGNLPASFASQKTTFSKFITYFRKAWLKPSKEQEVFMHLWI